MVDTTGVVRSVWVDTTGVDTIHGVCGSTHAGFLMRHGRHHRGSVLMRHLSWGGSAPWPCVGVGVGIRVGVGVGVGVDHGVEVEGVVGETAHVDVLPQGGRRLPNQCPCLCILDACFLRAFQSAAGVQ